MDEEDPVVVPEDQAIVVPSINLPLSEDQLEHLQSQVSTDLNRNESVTKYIEIVSMVHEILKRPKTIVSGHKSCC